MILDWYRLALSQPHLSLSILQINSIEVFKHVCKLLVILKFSLDLLMIIGKVVIISIMLQVLDKLLEVLNHVADDFKLGDGRLFVPRYLIKVGWNIVDACWLEEDLGVLF